MLLNLVVSVFVAICNILHSKNFNIVIESCFDPHSTETSNIFETHDSTELFQLSNQTCVPRYEVISTDPFILDFAFGGSVDTQRRLRSLHVSAWTCLFPILLEQEPQESIQQSTLTLCCVHFIKGFRIFPTSKKPS